MAREGEMARERVRERFAVGAPFSFEDCAPEPGRWTRGSGSSARAPSSSPREWSKAGPGESAAATDCSRGVAEGVPAADSGDGPESASGMSLLCASVPCASVARSVARPGVPDAFIKFDEVSSMEPVRGGCYQSSAISANLALKVCTPKTDGSVRCVGRWGTHRVRSPCARLQARARPLRQWGS